jgi:hypothetical protein
MQPIKKGGVVRGRLLFIFPGLSKDDLRSVKAIELGFQDAWGHKYSEFTESHGNLQNILAFPGLNPPKRRLPDSTADTNGSPAP